MLHTEQPTNQVARALPYTGPQLVGKVELALKLGWSRPALDRRLSLDQRFPVVYRGGQGKGRGWQFDFDAVKAYLEDSELTREESPASESGEPSDDAQDANPDASYASVEPIVDVKEETALARLKIAQARLLEDKLAVSRGDLIQASDLKDAISTALIHLGKGLEALPDQIVAQLGLTPEHGLTVRTLINALRSSMVADLQKVFQSNG